MENSEENNSCVVEKIEATSNHDPLANIPSDNGSIRSVDVNHHYHNDGSITHRQNLEAVVQECNESVRDAFTTISVYFCF